MLQEVKFSRVDGADRDFANYLKELAQRVEEGKVGDCVVVFDDREGFCFERYANFKDRWRMLAALEYAKDAVLRAGD